MTENKTSKSHLLIMILLLTLTLTLLYMTILFMTSFKFQLNQYLDSLIPPNSISFIKSDNSPITLSDLADLNKEVNVFHTHLYMDDYQLIGIGEVKDRYNSQYVYNGIDDSRYYDSLIIGKPFSNHDEIVISKALAEQLTDEKLENIVGAKVNLWYKHLNKVKGKTVMITGISNDLTLEIYNLYDANRQHCKELFNEEVSSHYGILYVSERIKDYQYLSSAYQDFHFTIVGQTTKDNAQNFIKKTALILICLSIIFIIITVYFFYQIAFYQVFVLEGCSVFFSYFMIHLIIMILNGLFSHDLLYDWTLFIVDYGLFIRLYGGLFLIITGLKRGLKLKRGILGR